MTDHRWAYAGDRPTLDLSTVMGKYRCVRCRSSYEMEILAADIGRPQDPPAWKNVDPDCDSVITKEVMGS